MASLAQGEPATALALTEFTLFPKLPTEIRIKIFRNALPTGPRGMRWVRVDFKGFKPIFDMNNARETMRYGLEFELIDHEHNPYVKDVRLLRTCIESRNTYLEFFDRSLRVGENGLINFSKHDIIYIENLWLINHYLPRDDRIVESIRCEKLAGPDFCFQKEHESFNIASKSFDCWKELKLLGPVWNECLPGEELVEDMLDSLSDVKSIKDFLEKSGDFNKETLRNVELCVWDRDGNHLSI